MKGLLGKNVYEGAAGGVGIAAAGVGGGAGAAVHVLLLVGLLLQRANGAYGLERLGILGRVAALNGGGGAWAVGGDADVHGKRVSRFGAYSKVVCCG